MLLSTLAGLMAKLVLMMGLGMYLKKSGIIDDKLQGGLTQLVMKVFLPAMLIAGTNTDLAQNVSTGMVQSVLAAAGYYLAAMALCAGVARLLPVDKNHRRAFQALAIFGNNGFIGVPVVLELLGAEGIVYLSTYNIVFTLLLFTYGAAMMGGAKRSMKQVLLQPVTIATLLSILLIFSPVKLPAFLGGTLGSLGACTTPISMILVGCALAQGKLSEVFTDKLAYLVSLLRLLVLPALVLAAVRLLGFDYTLGTTVVLAAALPSAALLLPFAEQSGTAPHFTARAIAQSTLLMAVGIPVMALLCARFLQ